MSRRSEENLRGIPAKPYDLLREGLIVLTLVTIAVIALSFIFGSPDYPPVTGEDVARRQPVAYVDTALGYLIGTSGVTKYGPPYTPDYDDAQELFDVRPANLIGVTIPLDVPRDFVLNPLARTGVLREDVGAALREYQAAPEARRRAWLEAYRAAVKSARVVDGRVHVSPGDYGPVPLMMDGLLALGRAGLLEGALESGPRLPFTVSFTRSLLFFQDDVDHGVAERLDMLGEQWGISHETGPYPGAWWLWPYTFWYQIPPMSTSDNGDLQVGTIMVVIFAAMLLAPFIPIVNRLPRWIPLHRLIWRDWYRRQATQARTSGGHRPSPDER